MQFFRSYGFFHAIAALVLATAAATAHAAEPGLVVMDSPHAVDETADRLEAALDARGMTVFARIDHAGGARDAGLQLAPTELVIFGNPKVGTPLMNCTRSVAIDLPQKMLIWEDDAGQVRVAYNDPAYLKSRHGVEGCDEVFARVAGALDSFAKAAISP